MRSWNIHGRSARQPCCGQSAAPEVMARPTGQCTPCMRSRCQAAGLPMYGQFSPRSATATCCFSWSTSPSSFLFLGCSGCLPARQSCACENEFVVLAVIRLGVSLVPKRYEQRRSCHVEQPLELSGPERIRSHVVSGRRCCFEAIIRVISAIFLKDTLDAAQSDAENLVVAARKAYRLPSSVPTKV